jgi:hypothetical protein
MFPVLPHRPSTQGIRQPGNVSRSQTEASAEIPGETPITMHLANVKDRPIPESDCLLASVQGLREELIREQHHGLENFVVAALNQVLISKVDLTQIVQEAVFVGIVGLNQCLSLIQHAKRLYLVNHAALACVFIRTRSLSTHLVFWKEVKSSSINLPCDNSAISGTSSSTLPHRCGNSFKLR